MSRKQSAKHIRVFIILLCLCLGITACTPQSVSALRKMYGDRYLYQNGEHYYVFYSNTPYVNKINLAGLSEEKLDRESPYELCFIRVFKRMQEDDGVSLQFLEYTITNHQDYDITLHMEQYILERKISGAWYTCISEGESRILELQTLPAEESVSRQVLLSRSVYTDSNMNRMEWEDLPAGQYRLLQKLDAQYIEMEFDIP